MSIEDKYKGQTIWGTDGSIPNSHYKSIKVKIGKLNINIPQKELDNLFNINIGSTFCYYDRKNNKLYITAMNSDGAGSYEVLFILQNNKYLGRKMYIPS